MPRLVRRKPMLERIKENLDPVDWLVFLSESFDSSDLDTKSLGTTIGLGCNFVYLLARANSGRKSKNVDDVFGDTGSAGWAGWFVRHFCFRLLKRCNILTHFVGKLSHSRLERALLHEWFLYLHAPPALSSLRDTSRQCALNTQRIPSARRLRTIHKFSSPSSSEGHLRLLSSGPRSPRRNPRRLGACHLGPNAFLAHALPILLASSYRRILALLANRQPGPTTKHDGLHDFASSSPDNGTDILFDP